MSIEDALSEHLTRKEKKSSRFTHAHAYASEALKCSRQISLRLLGVPAERKLKLATLLAFKVGEDIHKAVQTAMANSPDYSDFREEVEWGLEPDNLVTGRADGLYRDADGKLVVVEIKSMNPRAFKFAIKRDAPHIEHAMQAHLSAYVLKADYIHLLYVNKAASPLDEESTIEWLAEADYFTAEVEFERLLDVVRKSNNGIVADRLYEGEVIGRPESKKFPCDYCDWRETCLQLGAGEKKLAHNSIAKSSSTTITLVMGNDGQIDGM